MLIERSQLINKPENLRPHIVILGAGASVAAFPDGDATGKRLPTMDNLIEILDLGTIFEQANVEYKNRNFEIVYSELYEINPESDIVKKIEEKVHAYFNSLRLSDRPTLYDHLVLSLRSKDIIVTFNWDPLLFDAWDRNRHKVSLPRIAHLHGNVRIGYCLEHYIQGENGTCCPECGNELTPSRLLYPITKKNYNDPFINGQWKLLKLGLRNAFTITIFGYSAPSTDKKAIDIMKSAWIEERKHLIERTEIIDIKDKDVLRKQWSPFIIRTYYDYCREFYGSGISRFPRRSCEALVDRTRYGFFVENNPLPKDANFDELFSWLKPLIEAELRRGIEVSNETE